MDMPAGLPNVVKKEFMVEKERVGVNPDLHPDHEQHGVVAFVAGGYRGHCSSRCDAEVVGAGLGGGAGGCLGLGGVDGGAAGEVGDVGDGGIVGEGPGLRAGGVGGGDGQGGGDFVRIPRMMGIYPTRSWARSI